MYNSVNPQRRISLQNDQQQQEISIIDGRKKLQSRIQQTKDEIDKLQTKLDQFHASKAKTDTQKKYFQERRRFYHNIMVIFQKHLSKLIENQAILDEDGLDAQKLQSVVDVLEQLGQEGLQIMKSCLQISTLKDDEPLPKEFQQINERMARDYTINQSEDQLEEQFMKLNNYFQQEIRQFYTNPTKAPYLEFIQESQ